MANGNTGGRPYSLNSDIIELGQWASNSNYGPEQALIDYWRTAVPNDRMARLARVKTGQGWFFGIISRYDTNYGAFLGMNYQGRLLYYRMNNGSFSGKYVVNGF